MTSTGQLTARQRGHVHMHSSIFSGGSEDASVYAPGRQAEVYESLRGSLRQANGQPPELGLPSPLDMRATEMAGHRGLVLPSGSPEQRPQRMHATTSRTTLVHDGEAAAVVHAQGRDATIPREFWATSVNLQWCDSRHELCRPQVGALATVLSGAGGLRKWGMPSRSSRNSTKDKTYMRFLQRAFRISG